MTRQCELCDLPARMHCESDQASLCWACDARVHGANFLVARHSRVLLCRSCQSATPWRASGPWLGPTVSVCERCLQSRGGGGDAMDKAEFGGGGGGRTDGEADGSRNLALEGDDEEDEEREGEEEEEEGEIQVVPWSSTELEPAAASATPFASCSSGDESSSSRAFPNRMRGNADLASSHRQGDERRSPSGYRHQSPPSTAAVAGGHSAGRMPEEGAGSTPARPGRVARPSAPGALATWRFPNH